MLEHFVPLYPAHLHYCCQLLYYLKRINDDDDDDNDDDGFRARRRTCDDSIEITLGADTTSYITRVMYAVVRKHIEYKLQCSSFGCGYACCASQCRFSCIFALIIMTSQRRSALDRAGHAY